MGLDGGSLPNRREYLVKTRAENKTSHRADFRERSETLWTKCALSGKPLWEPIVACSRGNLYRKESVLKALIKRKVRAGDSGRKKVDKIQHIRSMKDYVNLQMQVNPTKYSLAVAGEDAAFADDRAMENFWICPLSQKVADSVTKFIFFSPCGHMMAAECARAKGADGIPCAVCGIAGAYFFINPDISDLDSQQKRFSIHTKQIHAAKIA